MTDSTTPLLLSVSDKDSADQRRPSSSLDDTIERCIGDFGWAQFLQAVLVSFAWVFDAQQTFITVFTDADPKWHCTTSTNSSSPSSSSSCNSSLTNVCHLQTDAWAWDLPPHTSIISEWSLQCASSIIKGLPASSFFMGCLAGGILLATLADSSLGRKNMLLLSCLLMSITGLLTTVVSTNIWTYAALRFLCGFGRGTIGTCALVLSSELVGKRWRSQVGIIGFLFFTLGFLSLPAMAFLNRTSSWRLLYLWTCVPTLFYCLLVHYMVHESPRWLYAKGHKEKFVAALKSISPNPINCSSLTLSFFGSLSTDDLDHDDLYSAIRILLDKGWAFRRLIAVMIVGFGTGMVYYGMPLGVGNLAFNNLYLSVALNALSELPASLVTFFLIGKLNRRTSLLGFTILSGICSVICAVMMMKDGHGWRNWKKLQLSMEMGSFFCACTAFNLLLIYTLELFPTSVRNTAISMVRQALVLGGVFSPVLVAAGSGSNSGLYSYGVFGVTIALCGLFVICLPETRNGVFCDTMDEEEQKQSNAIVQRDVENA